MELNLIEKQYFATDNTRKVGHFRCDFVEGELSNQWFPNITFPNNEVIESDILAILEAVKEALPTFDSVTCLCGGTGYDKRRNRFVEHGGYDCWIDLIPVKKEYNFYLHIYKIETIM